MLFLVGDDASPALLRKPHLHELDRIAGRRKKVKVINKTAHLWKQVATRLYFEGHDILRIGKDQHQAEDACRTVFIEWLEGKGRTPTTWGTVLEVLNEAEQGELANDLEEVLNTTATK